MQRRRPYDYGNDPVNWKSDAPTPSRANVLGGAYSDGDSDGLSDSWETAHGLNPASAADAGQDLDADGRSNYQEFLDGTDPASAGSSLAVPIIVTHPESQTSFEGASVSFTVTAQGTPELTYQWRFNDLPIPGATGNSFALENLGSSHNGDYSVSVQNAAGFVVSRPAKLVVNVPPRFTLHPVSQIVTNGTNATFTAAAVGTGLLRYQWKHQGLDLPNATSATLFLTNVGLSDSGEYTVMAIDDLGSAISQPAFLTVLVRPFFVEQPAPVVQAVAPGSNATITARAQGTLPIGFRWRRNGGQVANPNLSFTTNLALSEVLCTLTITNVQTSVTGRYDVVITNMAFRTPGVLSANAFVWLQPVLRILQLQLDGTVQMNLSGQLNETYMVEVSENLTNWAPLKTVVYTTAPTPFTDTVLTNRVRFYRARLVE